tara:strand:- start:317 stop:742 length:426 start_codon:yes stop_codon:yes gene_type:complete
MGLFNFGLKKKDNSLEILSGKLSKDYYQHFFVGKHGFETTLQFLKSVNIHFISRGKGMNEELVNDIAFNFDTDIPTVIFCICFYDYSTINSSPLQFIKYRPVMQKVVFEEYNKVCPNDQKVNLAFDDSKALWAINSVLSFI